MRRSPSPRRRLLLAAGLASASAGPLASVAAAEPAYASWDALLRRHVAWDASGSASSVSYRGFEADRAELRRVLDAWSAVTRAQYEGWRRDDRLAFLINAYNGFTIELVLTRYPDLRSIKDLGTLLQSPWRRRFFALLGETRHLDWIEHDTIRAPGAFDEPRIHFALVCASIGCPALRPEAFTAARLETQLEDGVRRFLRDRSRNRWNPQRSRLEVSKIFDWYRGDFEQGHRGIASLPGFFARHADLLADDPAARATIREARAPIAHLDYDWALNDQRG